MFFRVVQVCSSKSEDFINTSTLVLKTLKKDRVCFEYNILYASVVGSNCGKTVQTNVVLSEGLVKQCKVEMKYSTNKKDVKI